MLAAFNVTAQTETSNFPYNPDVDQDGIIGVADILQLLSTFGLAFQVQVALNSDSTSAVFFPPGWNTSMSYYDCHSRCDSLPGPWHMISPEGIATHLGVIRDSVSTITSYNMDFWQNGWGLLTREYPGNDLPIALVTSNEYASQGEPSYPTNSSQTQSRRCLCELRQRPRVEYSQCQGDPQSVLDCVEEKTQQGWYPLDLIPFGSNSMLQTMWRWED